MWKRKRHQESSLFSINKNKSAQCECNINIFFRTENNSFSRFKLGKSKIMYPLINFFSNIFI